MLSGDYNSLRESVLVFFLSLPSRSLVSAWMLSITFIYNSVLFMFVWEVGEEGSHSISFLLFELKSIMFYLLCTSLSHAAWQSWLDD